MRGPHFLLVNIFRGKRQDLDKNRHNGTHNRGVETMKQHSPKIRFNQIDEDWPVKNKSQFLSKLPKITRMCCVGPGLGCLKSLDNVEEVFISDCLLLSQYPTRGWYWPDNAWDMTLSNCLTKDVKQENILFNGPFEALNCLWAELLIEEKFAWILCPNDKPLYY